MKTSVLIPASCIYIPYPCPLYSFIWDMRTTVSAKRNNLISTYCFKVAMGHDLGFRGMLFTPIVFFFCKMVENVAVYHNHRCTCNKIWTHNYLVRKQTLNHSVKLASLAKGLSVRLRTEWLWVQISLQSLKLQISHLFWAKCSLTFRQLQSVDKHTKRNKYYPWTW